MYARIYATYFGSNVQIGNAWIDDNHGEMGIYEYLWKHALNSDETYEGIYKYCDFVSDIFSSKCTKYQIQASDEPGDVDIYNIYAPLCKISSSSNTTYISIGSMVNGFDPCSDYYVDASLNLKEVQGSCKTYTLVGLQIINTKLNRHFNQFLFLISYIIHFTSLFLFLIYSAIGWTDSPQSDKVSPRKWDNCVEDMLLSYWLQRGLTFATVRGADLVIWFLAINQSEHSP
ncbi:putative carboxypeptidase D [Rosa chinensis]|uniref:Putative carboxypeptidase D n=1 Tax=Rosa chinensis TaxID=74649 RepID=A0A2P6Q0D8_ROSCH|nr:putative carboxypeptidase D [Rosa chinensis]